MKRMKVHLLMLMVVGVALMMTGCKSSDQKIIGLLDHKEPSNLKLTTQETSAVLKAGGDGWAVFEREGVRGLYVTHPVQNNATLKIKWVYGDSQRIVVAVAETAGPEKAVKNQSPLQALKPGTATVATLLPQVSEKDQRRITLQFDAMDSLLAGKALKTIEAKCHPAVAYSAVRYHFEPTDAKITATLYVDKGPTPLGDKVMNMALKDGDLVMVTYVVQADDTKPSEIVDVVKKPTVGMPGGPQ